MPPVEDSGGLSAFQRGALLVLRIYKGFFSPLYSGSCRFVPSCSDYAVEAVGRFGVCRGSMLTLRRLARCHPFGGHGLDPVPTRNPRV